jgi:hypothetical protein
MSKYVDAVDIEDRVVEVCVADADKFVHGILGLVDGDLVANVHELAQHDWSGGQMA